MINYNDFFSLDNSIKVKFHRIIKQLQYHQNKSFARSIVIFLSEIKNHELLQKHLQSWEKYGDTRKMTKKYNQNLFNF